MAELNRDQRFLPCLLDRLRDDDPKNEKEETAGQRSISLQDYRRSVVRDLQWLFNSSALFPAEDPGGCSLADYPAARQSVINFGLRQLCGLMAPDLSSLERELSDALKFFEPRILKHNVSIKASLDGHLLTFEIKGELWAEPMPEQLYLQTQIDLENGQVVLGDRGNG